MIHCNSYYNVIKITIIRNRISCIGIAMGGAMFKSVGSIDPTRIIIANFLHRFKI
jgi:hypothetical protein